MGNDRGFTLIELIVTAGLIGVCAAIAIPAMNNAVDRNKVITSAELLAQPDSRGTLVGDHSQPAFPGDLQLPGSRRLPDARSHRRPLVDNAGDRCTTHLQNDGPPVYLPDRRGLWRIRSQGPADQRPRAVTGVSGGALPFVYGVTYGSYRRNVSVSAQGRITVTDDE